MNIPYASIGPTNDNNMDDALYFHRQHGLETHLPALSSTRGHLHDQKREVSVVRAGGDVDQASLDP